MAATPHLQGPLAGSSAAGEGHTNMERPSSSMQGGYGQTGEPEPASVAARLKREALANPQADQSVEELLSSMGVSLFADQRMLDISMAVEYGGPKPPHSPTCPECQALDSIPVAVPLSLPGIKPSFTSNNPRSGTHRQSSSQALAAGPSITAEERVTGSSQDQPQPPQDTSNGSSGEPEKKPVAGTPEASQDTTLVSSPAGLECSSPPSLHSRHTSASSSPSPNKGLHRDMSGGRSPDDASMVSSPDSYMHEALEERSELVNIAEHEVDGPATPPILPWKRSGCARCGRGSLLLEKEYCMTCGAKYCGSCLLAAVGSMPEGRKCVTCLGRPVMGARRAYIGKPSRLLKHLLSPLEVQQIMKAEKECPANQLRPEQVVVNSRPLAHEELTMLLNCPQSPGRLKPGRYWYDGQTGLWGKEGRRPDRIVSPSLRVGGNLQPNASNGKTHVFMNGRELGKLELKMLKFAGVNCVPDTHLWVEHDGSYSEEGFKNVKGNIWGKEGNLWEKASIKLLYPFFSLPTPRSTTGVGDGSGRHSDRFPGPVDPLKIHKLLLLGHEGSGRSTIFKQAKILYNQGFTKEELVSFKCLIQANINKYMGILLEGRERFEEEEDELANAPANKELSTSAVGSSETINVSSLPQPDNAGILKWNNDKRDRSATENIYRLKPSMKQLSDWFMESMAHGNSESIISPSSAFNIEQLWLSSAVQATFQRRSELPFLPDLASVFLNRVVEVCKSDFEPAELDILQTEGLSQGSGLVHIEICLDDKDVGSWQDADTCTGLDRYQVIRVGGKGMSDRHKWLDMFEDVRAVVFCVALSDYNALWSDRSGNPSNKMIETRDLFESILRHPCFQDTPFVLLLNKYDVFQEKIEQGVPLPTCTWFSDFRPVGTSHHTAQNQAQQAYQYIAHKYKELFNSVNCTGRKLFTFQLNALDKTTVSGAFRYVKEILKWEEHKAQGWGIIPEESSYSTDISSFSQRSMPRQPDLFRRQQY